MNENQKLFRKYFENAPKDIQALIKKLLKNSDTVASVGQKNNLDDTKIGQLQTEIALTLVGLQFISKFRTNLVEQLKITYDKAIKIASDVNSQVFGPEVLETLKQMEADMQKIEAGEDVGFENETAPSTENLPDLAEKSPPRTTPETTPSKIIPDHQDMLKREGPHVHDQPSNPTPTITKPNSSIFGSIVDQKLSSITAQRNEKYKNADPYREPIN